MVETFEHIYLEDRPLALSECYRVLAPGGRLVLSTPNFHSVVERFKRLAVTQRWIRERLPSMCYPDAGTERSQYHPYQYHHPLPDQRIALLLTEAGFFVDRTKHFLFMLKNTAGFAFGAMKALESLGEGLPGFRRLAATSCFIAHK